MNTYPYKECGLDYVYLLNGFMRAKTADGDEVVVIDDVAGLHVAIREEVVELARPLTPKEFWFLRREINVSQRQLASIVGVDEQTISVWERGNCSGTALRSHSGSALTVPTLIGPRRLQLHRPGDTAESAPTSRPRRGVLAK